MAVSRLMLSVLVLSTMTISSTVSQTCTNAERLCRGKHNPQCTVKYVASSSAYSNSTCGLKIRCSYNNDFVNNGALCFVLKTVLPTITLQGLTPEAYNYNLRLKFMDRKRKSVSKQIIKGTWYEAFSKLTDIITQYANSNATSFRVVSVYLCEIVTPCSPEN